jgi:hypothetical protein
MKDRCVAGINRAETGSWRKYLLLHTTDWDVADILSLFLSRYISLSFFLSLSLFFSLSLSPSISLSLSLSARFSVLFGRRKREASWI